MTDPHPRRIIIALTGASGIQYGVRLVQTLAAQPDLELTLMLSKAAWQVALAEIPGLPGAVASGDPVAQRLEAAVGDGMRVYTQFVPRRTRNHETRYLRVRAQRHSDRRGGGAGGAAVEA